jgi:hypothetical protein
MIYRIFLTGLCALLLTTTTQSQYLHTSKDSDGKAFLTGSLQNDFVMQANHITSFNGADSIGTIVTKTKYSPLAAGLLSAVVPGAGQFYTKSYWQSAAFFSAEVLTWVAYAMFERQGNQRTNAFQQYADEHWSVVRYANWINSPNGFQQYYRSGIIIGNPSADVSQPWNYINWNLLNQSEEDIANQIVGSGFTHKLAPYADQQYYEMIGKYSQFGGGWDDAATFQPGGFTRADMIANNGIGNVSPRFIEYSHMRGDANSSYNIATTVSYIIVANHVFSALEAALNASKINHRIQLEGHIESRRIYGNLVEFVPTLQVKYEL